MVLNLRSHTLLYVFSDKVITDKYFPNVC